MAVAVEVVVADGQFHQLRLMGWNSSRAMGFVFEVGNHGGELDVEPFVENVSVQIRPFAFVFAPVGQFSSKKCLQSVLRFRPILRRQFRTGERGRELASAWISSKRQAVKVIAGQGF